MGTEAGTSLRNATIVLLGSFGIYPLPYSIPVFVDVTAAWLTAIQVGYSGTDVVAAGLDTHPEPVWSSHVHKSDGVPPEVRRLARS
jgi:hypothetical protein